MLAVMPSPADTSEQPTDEPLDKAQLEQEVGDDGESSKHASEKSTHGILKVGAALRDKSPIVRL